MALTEREKLEETIRECRGMIKDAKHVKKELQEVVAEAQEAARKAVHDEVEAILHQTTAEGIEAYKESVREAMDDAVEHVHKEFDKLANIMLHGNSQGRGESLVDVWEREKSPWS